MVKKILITGGHVTPALALIDYLQKHHKCEIVFVGRRHANEYEKRDTFEYQEIRHRDIKFYDLQTGRLKREFTDKALNDLKKVPKGLMTAYNIIKEEKPDFVFSFGGYLALPVVIAAYFSGIPIFTHEQTISPGLANRIISWFAKKVFVSFPETDKFFNADKVEFSGNLIRKSILQNHHSAKIKTDRKVIYITGGSLGAHSINEHVENILPKLLEKFFVIHQTGNVAEFNDFEKFSKIKDPNYLVREHFFENDLSIIFHSADLIVSRSGANTIFELIALSKPSILIPLPWSAGGEQKAHAILMESAGVSQLFDQNEDSEKLYFQINEAIDNLETLQNNFSQLKHYYKPHAEEFIASFIFKTQV